jgi:hypothetical protein
VARDTTLPMAKAAADHVAALQARTPETSRPALEPGVQDGTNQPEGLAPVTLGGSPAQRERTGLPSTITAGPRTTVQGTLPKRHRAQRWAVVVAVMLAVVSVVVFYSLTRSPSERDSSSGPDQAGLTKAADPERGTLAASPTLSVRPAIESLPEVPSVDATIATVGLPTVAGAPATTGASDDAATDGRPDVVSAATVAPSLDTVRLSFPSLPTNAKVLVAGEPKTVVDGVAEVTRTPELVEVVVSAAGFREWRGSVRPDRDRRVPVALRRDGSGNRQPIVSTRSDAGGEGVVSVAADGESTAAVADAGPAPSGIHRVYGAAEAGTSTASNPGVGGAVVDVPRADVGAAPQVDPQPATIGRHYNP